MAETDAAAFAEPPPNGKVRKTMALPVPDSQPRKDLSVEVGESDVDWMACESVQQSSPVSADG